MIERSRNDNLNKSLEQILAETSDDPIENEVNVEPEIKIGDVVACSITDVKEDLGLFVNCNITEKLLIPGLIHKSNIDWYALPNWAQLYRRSGKVAKKLKVKIIDIRKVDDRVSRLGLSLKHMTEDPRPAFFDKAKIGDTFRGRVISKANYGVLVRNEQDIQGLCHISQIQEEIIKNPADIPYDIGEVINLTIIALDKEKPEIQLTSLSVEEGIKRLKKKKGDIV